MKQPDIPMPTSSPSESHVIGITGATGYLGQLLTSDLSNAGHKVIRLVRNPSGEHDRRFVLGDGIDRNVLANIDLLIHGAYDLQLKNPESIWQVNVIGTEDLLKSAHAAGIRQAIVISSMSAYSGTKQIYGRAKLEIESVALSLGYCVVRPGLVYGDRPGGMAGTLRSLSKLPVLPEFRPDCYQYPVSEESFVSAMAALIAAGELPNEVIGIARPLPVSFRELMSYFSGKDGRTPRFVPVPWRPAYMALKVAEKLGIPLPVRADSLLGLVKPAPSVPGVETLKKLGVDLSQDPNFPAPNTSGK